MTVNFKGAITLGQMMPGFNTAINQAREYLAGSEDDQKLKNGILDEFQAQVDTLQKRKAEVDKKVAEFEKLVQKAEDISEALQGIVNDIADNLGKAGVYAYTIQGSTVSGLGGEISTAVSQNGAGEDDDLPGNATVSGVLILGVDGGAISAIQSVIKLF